MKKGRGGGRRGYRGWDRKMKIRLKGMGDGWRDDREREINKNATEL